MASREIKIGKNSDLFTVEELPAMASFLLQPRIAPAAMEVIAGFGDVFTGEGEVDPDKWAAKDISALAPLVGRVFSKLPPAELRFVMLELLDGARMNGKPLFHPEGNPFDILMRGRTLDTWRLLWFALEVNYPDFFDLFKGTPPPEENRSAT